VTPTASQVTRHVLIGQRIRTLRLAKKLRQVDLAASAGMSWRHLIRMERGEGGEPRRETLTALAAALGVQRSDLTGSDEDDEEAASPMVALDEYLRVRVREILREETEASR
jgi:transcriptional regulator with XRE-family HTH domain